MPGPKRAAKIKAKRKGSQTEETKKEKVLEDLTRDELVEKAKEVGVSPWGKKAEIIERLRDADD